MFWIVAAGLTGLTCLALLMSFSKGGIATEKDSADNHDKVFYQSQLQEIVRQKTLGLIGSKEAEAAETEAARRLLASQEEMPLKGKQVGSRNASAALTVVLIPVFVLPIYIWLGAPTMPSFPLADRLAAAATNQQRVATQQGENLPPGFNVENALAQIETHLAKSPDDGSGHEVVAPIYLRLGRYDVAVRAFQSALRILGNSAERQVSLGEALVYQAKGVVTGSARKAFETTLDLDNDNLQAQFFLSMAAQQDGDIPKARAMLYAIQSRIHDGDLKNEITRQLATMDAIPQTGGAIAALPQGQQQEAIRGMVENLAQRLATSGGAPEEWARLVRALRVLGENERVEAILGEARLKFADKPDQLQLVEQAAKAEK